MSLLKLNAGIFHTPSSLITVFGASSVQSRNSWGKVNKTPPRGKSRPNKYFDPAHSRLRMVKFQEIKLPDFEKERQLDIEGRQNPAILREHYKKKGILPPTNEKELPMYLASSNAAFEPYVPNEGEGVISMSDSFKGWAAQKAVDPLKNKGKSFRAVRKIRTYEPDFDPRSFGEEATEIYTNTHNALAGRKFKKLHDYVTEYAYPRVIHRSENATMYWEFIESIQPPSVVQVRCEGLLENDNYFAQATVRMHTKQVLAIYDRFGRLIHGHPHVAKDVLEWVVFEKHIANIYGKWRLHEKIIPSWAQKSRSQSLLTNILDKKDLVEAEDDETVEASKKNTEDDDSETETIRDKYGNVIREKK